LDTPNQHKKEVKKKIVISDIATQLGVSVTTVSFILNGKAKEKRISKAVIERVEKLVKELGYKPSQLAKSLRTGKTNIIGLIVEDIANPFFANIARLIEEKAYNEGYRILYCSTENDINKTKELIQMFRDRHVDGYIITPSAGVEEEVNVLLKNNLPVVLFDRYFPGLSTNYVVVDNFEATNKAANHLFQQGFENIAFLTIESNQTQMQERLDGYKKALGEHKKEPIVKKILFQDDPKEIVKQISAFLTEEEGIDSIIFGTNYLGIKGLEVIKSLNIKIPSEIGVISFDDHDVFPLYSPSITAISQPIEEISYQLIKTLLNQLDSPGSVKAKEIHNIQLSATLVIRESSVKSL
jgi:LacI family transcriptional regulator